MQGVLARYAIGPWLESRSGLVLHPHPFPVTSGGSVWIRSRTASSKGKFSSRWYLHDSEQIRGRVYLSRRKSSRVVVWLECSHGTGELLGLSPGRAICFFVPCDIYSMTSFDVGHQINTIIQDSVLAYKKDHAGVGAKITGFVSIVTLFA